MAGPHPSDGASLRPKRRIPGSLGGIDGWRIALSVDLGGYEVDEDVAANTLAAADALRECGALVEEVALGWDPLEIGQAARAHFGTIFGPIVAEVVAEHESELTAYAVAFAREAATVTKEDFVRGLELEAEVYTELATVLERHRLLLCPTLAFPSLVAGEDYVDRGIEVNGIEVGKWEDALMTLPFNICSRCPVMSVPSGFARTGVPTGVQLVGRTYDDVSVFRAAAAYERARPWLDTPERRPSFCDAVIRSRGVTTGVASRTVRHRVARLRGTR